MRIHPLNPMFLRPHRQTPPAARSGHPHRARRMQRGPSRGAGGEQPCTCPSFRPIPGQPKKRPNRARHYAAGYRAEPHEEGDQEDEASPNMSLAETLLRRLGIPIPANHPENSKRTNSIDLSAPLTTAKVAEAIATVSIAVLENELPAQQANVTLFALQTLLSALRLNMTEEKMRRQAERQEEPPCTPPDKSAHPSASQPTRSRKTKKPKAEKTRSSRPTASSRSRQPKK